MGSLKSEITLMEPKFRQLVSLLESQNVVSSIHQVVPVLNLKWKLNLKQMLHAMTMVYLKRSNAFRLLEIKTDLDHLINNHLVIVLIRKLEIEIINQFEMLEIKLFVLNSKIVSY